MKSRISLKVYMKVVDFAKVLGVEVFPMSFLCIRLVFVFVVLPNNVSMESFVTFYYLFRFYCYWLFVVFISFLSLFDVISILSFTCRMSFVSWT